ncbi:hypothetical protein CK203_099816 [Vitis vinifera]|uniref:Uncharacterized protein n=1 Tax=Vitis vinifera TaxID=29760 RepID=A0A438DBH3_VITVI|nr:hypothetical protein CK203_099816 [Vitis vinifera]
MTLEPNNAGLNVKFDGRKAITEAPASGTSIQIREGNNRPVVHKGQFIYQDSWESQI